MNLNHPRSLKYACNFLYAMVTEQLNLVHLHKMNKKANCTEHVVELDHALGHVVCTNCGQVLEMNAMVSELGFSESSKGAAIADGFTLKLGQARAKSKAGFAGSATLRSHQESSEATRDRGHASIERAGNMQGINMGPNLIEKAKVYSMTNGEESFRCCLDSKVY